ncbi:hypothetical protein P152DRAFT_3025 [Eremomyces bilateralis CBS 781.70]|uniref:Uncharacterized protein n=1 Tax=Eremomyces bilateralis CBS 781.70 TaxID=1392243 RepID=A0A6G1GFI7_9PEZI|nr:uncharacterized protein P152DRAFT_3025 [Eremomyces bilateralis CBS 781.70]KAF1816875.1 hypothetical protein P152DRAFT_3025 [Eremomyces bilateralis CBS 781.70]
MPLLSFLLLRPVLQKTAVPDNTSGTSCYRQRGSSLRNRIPQYPCPKPSEANYSQCNCKWQGNLWKHRLDTNISLPSVHYAYATPFHSLAHLPRALKGAGFLLCSIYYTACLLLENRNVGDSSRSTRLKKPLAVPLSLDLVIVLDLSCELSSGRQLAAGTLVIPPQK